jgi:hypothetical protein
VEEEPIICAFTADELERLADWGDRMARETDLEPVERELLERTKRLVAAARLRQRQMQWVSRGSGRRPPSD